MINWIIRVISIAGTFALGHILTFCTPDVVHPIIWYCCGVFAAVICLTISFIEYLEKEEYIQPDSQQLKDEVIKTINKSRGNINEKNK